MERVNKALECAKKLGFETVALLDIHTLEVRSEVRDMCAANKCAAYDKNWACPPACGTLEDCRKKMQRYSYGFLIQTVGDIEDSWDYEAMQELAGLHRKRSLSLSNCLKELHLNVLSLTAGGCTLCTKCAYPEPCRFPDQLLSSMEAYGLLVSQVCQDNGVNYYYGPNKLAYTGCVLLAV